MEFVSQTFSQAFSEVSVMTMWESVAVILAIAYLVLAMKANSWCWFAAFISTAIYTMLFWHVSLLMESVLNVFYMIMAIYGYWLWQHPDYQTQDGEREIVSWSSLTHGKLIVLTGISAVILGFVMDNYTQADFAYLDSATTCFAVMTTFLVAKKVLENWLYWVVINGVSIYLYFNKGLMLTTLLFIGYTIMALAGYYMWRKRMQHRRLALSEPTAI